MGEEVELKTIMQLDGDALRHEEFPSAFKCMSELTSTSSAVGPSQDKQVGNQRMLLSMQMRSF